MRRITEKTTERKTKVKRGYSSGWEFSSLVKYKLITIIIIIIIIINIMVSCLTPKEARKQITKTERKQAQGKHTDGQRKRNKKVYSYKLY